MNLLFQVPLQISDLDDSDILGTTRSTDATMDSFIILLAVPVENNMISLMRDFIKLLLLRIDPLSTLEICQIHLV
jgi:hypothetical protein